MATHSSNPEQIKNMFGSISGTYDLANDVITMGRAHSWRKKLVEWSGAKSGQQVLDCASGTGDLALEFKKAVGPRGRVVATDFCQEMLELAPKKAQKLKLDVELEVADVMNLPYENNTFDICSIAYGIRNVKDPVKALQEMARVVRKDGQVLVLETGRVDTPIIGTAIRVYFKHVVPRLGGIVSGRREAYEYLNQSSSDFPCKDDFLTLMQKTGAFKKLEFISLMGGASYIYRGTVI